MSLAESGRRFWKDWLDLDQLPSSLALGVRIMESEWTRQGVAACCAWEVLRRRAPFPSLAMIISQWLMIRCCEVGWCTPAPGVYPKMSTLVEYVEAFCEAADPARLVGAIEAYSQSSQGLWLKVAGGAKAEVLASALFRRTPGNDEVVLEFGLFVGYTAIQLAYRGKRTRVTGDPARGDTTSQSPRVMSFELDPIHVCIARHIVNLALLSTGVEALVGHSRDTLPAVGEMCGAQTGCFAFMDQRGTLFHNDLQHVERLLLPGCDVQLTADNTLKPGAPVFLWHLECTSAYDLMAWALSEFQTPVVEDILLQQLAVCRAELHIVALPSA
eukprot:CAMPEP_0171111148 /NCGR_PEP_ID=MMETSP0766_2-20121228/74045_1 /TAXON_ID=439317 /ORGANISM="Gambierdiscus australes, Strain CAWD 149" /LENGTH=327 /DNA_ID=CAMNT_0011573107 /DNA_START=98 /DNA_END=1078 /DNA_ORIENTATION=-